MYSRWMLLRFKIKQFIRILPVILLETILFVLILAGVGIYATRAIYGEKAIKEIKVGIVAEGDDRMADMLIRFVGGMDSFKDAVSLEVMSRGEAESLLKEGEIYGAVIVPEGIVDSILSGENVPAKILTGSAYSRIETEVFAQLSHAGASLLTTAQAGIYAADDFCAENERPDLIGQTEDALNAAYLKYALARSTLFKEKEVTAVKGVNLTDYYTISLLFAFLSFAGLAFGRYMQVEMEEREKLFKSRGIGTVQQYLIETAAFSAVFALLGAILSFPFYLFVIHNSKSSFAVGPVWIMILPIWFLMGVFLRGLFQILGNHAGSMGVCFVVLMAFMFASGVFIPSAFLPAFVEKAGTYLPYKAWMEGMAMILQGKYDRKTMSALYTIGLSSLAAGILAAVCRDRLALQGKGRYR
ncbi:MAG: ABC transporter permease [Lachnospiraceae bacterium]|nr:ABC transporter permease [Lachnospiraceae bacterium]